MYSRYVYQLDIRIKLAWLRFRGDTFSAKTRDRFKIMIPFTLTEIPFMNKRLDGLIDVMGNTFI